MLSFRQKLFLSYVVVFLVFLALLFPLASRIVEEIVKKSLIEQTTHVVALVKTAPDRTTLIRRLQEQGDFLFIRVTVVTPQGQVIYDSHISNMETELPNSQYLEDHPEIIQAIREGDGYSEDYSYVLGQELAYVAKAFSFHGEQLIMRTAFPLGLVHELSREFEIGFLTLGIVVLLLFSIMTSFIAHHLSRPVKQMINAIKPYEEGKVEHLPAIHLSKYTSPRDDFKRLADTLNSLSNRVETQIAALKHERNEKEAVLDSLIEGVVAVDDRGQVTFANHMALKMLEMQEHKLIGAKLSDLHHEEFHDVLIACQHQQEVLTFTCQLNELQKIYLDVVAVPMGRDRGAILVLQDKSLHYKALEMRKDFIANASHELKTPITIIKGFAETLQDMPHLSPKMVQEITSKIVRNTTRMEKLVKNLLKLADIENLPRSRLQRCRLSEVAETCKQMVESVYPTAMVTIVKPTEEPNILVDAELLELAIMNLMDNAAKYSTPPAQITVAIEPMPSQEQLKIIVADKGMGIPKEDLEYIFQRFYTVNKAHSRQLGGSGLGLSIVETIIEKHFGKISVTSILGEGTTFTIILPMNQREAYLEDEQR